MFLSYFLLISWSYFFCSSWAQFPRKCATAAALISKECCPIPPGFSKKCGAPWRGFCYNIRSERWDKNSLHYLPLHEKDERTRWPTAFFNRSCYCRTKFDGFDCSRCAFGRYGRNCEKIKVTVRQSTGSLTSKERLKYQNYLKLARQVSSPYQVSTKPFADMWDKDGKLKPSFVDVSVYDYYVWIHHYSATHFPFEESLKLIPNFSHNGQGFPTWHRYFVLAFERELQELTGDQYFAIPYWDWTVTDLTDVCIENLAGKTHADGNVSTTRSFNWYQICDSSSICDPSVRERNIYRDPGKTNAAFPARSDIDNLMRFPFYDTYPFKDDAPCSFRNVLEGNLNTTTGIPDKISKLYMHNAVHDYIGGTMKFTTTAPNDLLFWMHHSFVDRLLEKGLRRYQFDPSSLTDTDAPLGHNRRSAIVPSFPVYTHENMFKISLKLGYSYENLDLQGYSSLDKDQNHRWDDACPLENF